MSNDMKPEYDTREIDEALEKLTKDMLVSNLWDGKEAYQFKESDFLPDMKPERFVIDYDPSFYQHQQDGKEAPLLNNTDLFPYRRPQWAKNITGNNQVSNPIDIPKPPSFSQQGLYELDDTTMNGQLARENLRPFFRAKRTTPVTNQSYINASSSSLYNIKNPCPGRIVLMQLCHQTPNAEMYQDTTNKFWYVRASSVDFNPEFVKIQEKETAGRDPEKDELYWVRGCMKEDNELPSQSNLLHLQPVNSNLVPLENREPQDFYVMDNSLGKIEASARNRNTHWVIMRKV
jgi:hypothetical protein